MRRYLDTLDEPGLTVFYVEYDRKPFFQEMMAMKETIFANYQVPYVRYYGDGALATESNLVFMKKKFLRRFDARTRRCGVVVTCGLDMSRTNPRTTAQSMPIGSGPLTVCSHQWIC